MNPDYRGTDPEPDSSYCAAIEKIVRDQSTIQNPPGLDPHGGVVPRLPQGVIPNKAIAK